MASELVGLVALVVVTGLIHGAEPGHGWPVAAAYAFDKDNVWLQGIAASTILGIGHLISSIVVVLGFFWLKSAAGLGKVPWLNYVAGGLLILLGIREYVSGGHSHGHDDHGHDDHDHGHGDDGHVHDDHGHGHGDDGHVHDDHGHGDDGHVHGNDDDHAHADHSGGAGPAPEPAGGATLDDVRGAREGESSHGDHDHSHGSRDHDHAGGHDHGEGGVFARIRGALPFGGEHSHGHLSPEEANSKGLWGIAWTAFVLGFAHEEEFELIGICTGTNYCVELTLLYAFSVVFALVGFTALLLAGYERYEDRMSEYAEYFPTISAAVLILMGIGFIAGIF